MVSHADDLSLDDVVSMSDLDKTVFHIESFIQSFRFSHPDRCFSQSDVVVMKVDQVVCFSYLSFIIFITM